MYIAGSKALQVTEGIQVCPKFKKKLSSGHTNVQDTRKVMYCDGGVNPRQRKKEDQLKYQIDLQSEGLNKTKKESSSNTNDKFTIVESHLVVPV